MFKNLIVNGCSYTSDLHHPTWATIVKESLNIKNYQNLASAGAGNYYICNSTINFLENNKFQPEETLVLIMWSGTGRKDLTISGEWWYHLQKTYHWGARSIADDYYLFSGGLTNSWQEHREVKKIFQPLYKISDPLSLTKDSLINFLHLEKYLQAKNFNYRCTSFFNYWQEDQESCPSSDYSIGFFCRTSPLYTKFNFSNWWFVDQQKNTLGEFATGLNEMDQTLHPTLTGHTTYANSHVLPMINKIHMQGN